MASTVGMALGTACTVALTSLTTSRRPYMLQANVGWVSSSLLCRTSRWAPASVSRVTRIPSVQCGSSNPNPRRDGASISTASSRAEDLSAATAKPSRSPKARKDAVSESAADEDNGSAVEKADPIRRRTRSSSAAKDKKSKKVKGDGDAEEQTGVSGGERRRKSKAAMTENEIRLAQLRQELQAALEERQRLAALLQGKAEPEETAAAQTVRTPVDAGEAAAAAAVRKASAERAREESLALKKEREALRAVQAAQKAEEEAAQAREREEAAAGVREVAAARARAEAEAKAAEEAAALASREAAARAREEAEARAKAEALARERAEAEAKAREEAARMVELPRQEQLRKLQQEHEFIAAKMFFYPGQVQAGKPVEIFFHRPASVLKDKSGVNVVGAFNNWQWQPFKAELKPSSEVPNDWWVCQIHIPEEAYQVDFVFHSTDNVYENNGGQDFYIAVTGGMAEAEFETMLNERKREEAEREAAEEAERERRAEEERRAAKLKAQQEAERKQARDMANDARNRLGEMRRTCGTSLEGVWRLEEVARAEGGERVVRLLYNRAGRPLAGSGAVWVHGGVNGWQDGLSATGELKPDNQDNGDWWSVQLTLPADAVVLNWVMADGPVGKAGAYDNNGRKDFAASVGSDDEARALFDELEERLLAKLERERIEREEREAKEAARRQEMKLAMKRRTKEAFLQSQAHVFYTEPADPRAGETVRVFYNPQNTVLHGRQNVWMRGSFNRWTHRTGCFLPVHMQPSANGTHLVGEVTVPHDAFIMDLVFMDSSDPNVATYDNRGGLDYHVPITGSTSKEPPLYIVHVALEMAPIAKVGGLGDVVTSLSRAILELGHKAEVILPKYDVLKYDCIQELQDRGSFAWGGTNWRMWFGYVEGIGVHFLEPESGIFWVNCIYGRKDDGHRFGIFCNAALEMLVQTGRQPDILHCHDWSSAPVAWLHAESYKQYGLGNARTVFTIHNLEFGQALIGRAMAACNMATTVSPTYAWEIGGHGAVAAHRGKFHGILNGIDPDIWDPMTDRFLPMRYSSEEVVEGKRAAKDELRRRLNLRFDDRPVVGIVTRLTAQKGIHLIKHAIWRTLDRGGQVVLLGSAPDPRVHGEFEHLAGQLNNSHNNMQRLCLNYDEPLSHLIYAGCDMILVPSMFEPCGLTQLIAMRYGAVPVVRKTGGLNDTVFDVDNDHDRARAQGKDVNGFSFEGADAAGLDYALDRAISGWYDGREWWNGLAKRPCGVPTTTRPFTSDSLLSIDILRVPLRLLAPSFRTSPHPTLASRLSKTSAAMPPWETYLARPPLQADMPYPRDTWQSAAPCDSVAHEAGSWHAAQPLPQLPSHLSSAFSALASAHPAHLPDRAFSPSLPHHAQGQAHPGPSVLPPSLPSAPFSSSAFAFPSLALETSFSALSLSLRSQSPPDPPARPSLPHAASAGSLRALASGAVPAPHFAPSAQCSVDGDSSSSGRRSASLIPYPGEKSTHATSSGSSPSSPASFVSSVSSSVAGHATADLSHDSLPADNPWYVSSPATAAPADGAKDEPGAAAAGGGKAGSGEAASGEAIPDALPRAVGGTVEEAAPAGVAHVAQATQEIHATHTEEVERLQQALRRAEAAAAEAQQAAAMAQLEMAQMQRACGEHARQVVRLRRELDSAGDAHLQLAAELVHLEDFAIAALQHDLKAEARRGLPAAEAALLDAPDEYGGCRQFYQTGCCHFGRGRRPCPNEASHFCLRCGRAHGTAPHLVLLRRLNDRCLLPQ
ncbi:unnamed protein product [Closterium sp. Yama58-4]|nr:unnamed protein product [Closterium sp. Yama58-4]